MFTLNLHRYIQYYLQLISPVHLLCCLHMLSFSQCEYFSTHCCTIVHIHCLHWIFTITCSSVYNYSPQFSVFAVYICIPFHNVILFHNYCPIDSITMSIAYPQHILAVLFTISVPNKLTALFTYAFLFTMWIFSTHYCTIVYMTMFTYNLLCLHAVMFKITLPSIMSVLVYLCLFFTMWIFSTHYFTIDSITLSTAYPQHIHTVLFTITLPSILYVLFTYASFSQCNIFSQLYTYFAVYIWFPFHNVNIFHTLLYNCLYDNVTNNLLCLHAVLFIITLPSILIVLCIYILSLPQW